MNPLISDLYAHQAWADARHWWAVEALPAARADRVIRDRLFHIHAVQRFFLWMCEDHVRPFDPPPPQLADNLSELREFVRQYHHDVRRLLDGMNEPELAQPVHNPFAPAGAAPVTLAEALTQCAMHSQYHRGQNATRIRELGGEPPNTDLITWYWYGREAADWRAA